MPDKLGFFSYYVLYGPQAASQFEPGKTITPNFIKVDSLFISFGFLVSSFEFFKNYEPETRNS